MISTTTDDIVNVSVLPGATLTDALANAGGGGGGLSPADRAKLDSIEAGATANSPDAALLARANHTGTQASSTIADLAPATRSTTATQLVAGSNVSITPAGDTLVIAATGGGGAADTAGETHAAPSKATPVNADELPLIDSAASWGLKKLTFANLKAWLGGLFVSKSGDTINGDLNVAGNVLVTGGGALGYGVGAGGTVTQETSKGTTVVLNKPSGRIEMHNESLAAGASVYFLFYSTEIYRYSNVQVDVDAPSVVNTLLYRVEVTGVGAGYCAIRLNNISGGSLSEPVGIIYNVTRASVS